MKKGKFARRGGALVEFAWVLFLLLSVLVAGIEFDRLLLVYTTLADSARVGARYAIVHGGTRTGTGDPASGATSQGDVVAVVKNTAKAGFLNTDKLDVSVQYPGSVDPTVDPGNSPGSLVVITVSYPYDPLTFLPITVNLSSTTRGVIVF